MPADRRDLRRRLFALAAQQGGYFTAAQAKTIGYSYQAQGYHVGAGNWLRINRGIFRLAEWVPDLHDDLARWSLWSRNRGVVSHETALSVHEIGEFESARVDLTVPPGFASRNNAVRLHVAELPADDVVDRSGFRVTTPARSLVDVAASGVNEDQLTRAIAEAAEHRLVSIRQLRTRAEMIDAKAALYIERALRRIDAL